MEYKIFIESFNKFPIDSNAVSAYLGFKEKQASVFLFEDFEELEDRPISRTNIIVGYIQTIRKYFDLLGVTVNDNFSIPPELEKYLGRKITYTTLGEFKRTAKVPVFIKPTRTKEFVAGVITKLENIPFFFKDKPDEKMDFDPTYVPDDTSVLLSEVVDFVSEYRCYVIDGELKGIKHYMGDIRVFPNTAVIDLAISDFTTAPVGYAIDFGITRDGRTLLVEANDGWGLGNYGLNDVTYSTLLAKRWLQIMETDLIIS